MKNALALKSFRHEATPEAVRRTLAAIDQDLGSGSLVRPTVDWSDAFRAAVDFATSHSRRVGSRSLDVLHVAVACEIGTERFASTDKRQRALAKRAGLKLADI